MEQEGSVRRGQAVEGAAKEPPEKRCPKCGRLLPVEAFNRCAKKRDGLQNYCKECSRAQAQSRRSAGRRTRDRQAEKQAQACPTNTLERGLQAGVFTRGAVRPESPEPAEEQFWVVTISFAGRPDLLDRVAAVADREDRTIEAQIRYWVRQAVEAMDESVRG